MDGLHALRRLSVSSRHYCANSRARRAKRSKINALSISMMGYSVCYYIDILSEKKNTIVVYYAIQK